MKKTKIICSIGPATQDYEVFKEIVKKGMNVARINFSHATLEERKLDEELVARANEELGTHIAILYDTKGPDLRTCVFENDYIDLVEGETIRLDKLDQLGTKERITFNYKQIVDNLEVGDIVLLDDGLIRLEIIEKHDDFVICKILDGATIKSRRGVNVPGKKLDVPFISKEDEEDIKYACDHDGDYLGISFVSSAEDIKEARALLAKYGKPNMPIITKVETAKAIENLDEIIDATDAIMVARGDLGVEVPMYEIPRLQKEMIRKCREKGKICIVATEMLASMYTSSRPTRAELTDIANAVIDGADAVMLSGETTMGKHPIDAVGFMASVCENTEKYLDYDNQVQPIIQNTTMSAIATSVVDSANLLKVKAIVAATISGATAKEISSYRPDSVIIAACPDDKAAKKLALNFGVYPRTVGLFETTDQIIDSCKEEAKSFLGLNEKDVIIIAGGFPRNSATNFMKIEEV